MSSRTTISPADAIDAAHTGDIWLFRGRSMADKAIRVATNSPVNHVAMAVALDDLPPLLWHTELGQTLQDVWTGDHHRGAQLNRLADAYAVWTGKYGQQAYVRQFSGEVPRAAEDELLRVIDTYDAKPFPTTGRLARRWVEGRFRKEATGEAVYCAQLLAITFRRMGLLDPKRPSNWYDPGKFWSGDRLELTGGASLGGELAVVEATS
ncbi:MAG: hypothetical protein ABW328_18030 [Ilumatobacteraceae bacterium]